MSAARAAGIRYPESADFLVLLRRGFDEGHHAILKAKIPVTGGVPANSSGQKRDVLAGPSLLGAHEGGIPSGRMVNRVGAFPDEGAGLFVQRDQDRVLASWSTHQLFATREG